MFGEMIGTISDFMYSYLLIIMLLAVGLYFTIRTRGVQLRLLAESIRVVGEKSSSRESVSAFQALMVSTASRVGTGNIEMCIRDRAIARAIATHPPIIMADEPTGALDSRTGRHVLEILRGLYREGTTILLITHDDGIAATARRVVRLSDGKIIADHAQEVDWE